MGGRSLYTPEEYLSLERDSNIKREYMNGGIYAMTGGTVWHAQIAVNISSSLSVQLKLKPCRVFSSDLKVKTAPSSMFAYPDVSVVCGDLQYHDSHNDVVTNPVVVVEVLSDSTEAYDRGKKFTYYRQIESLVEYVLISQKEPYIDIYSRQPDNRWIISTAVGMDGSLDLTSIGCTLKLAEIYDKVEFPLLG